MIIFGAYRAFGQEREFANYNCAVTIPDGWQKMTNLPPQPGLIGAFARPDKTRLVMLVVDTQSHLSGPLDDRSVSEFERGLERSGGGNRVSGKFIEIGGIKAYERLGQAAVKGKTVSILLQVLVADGKVYSLQGMRFDGDVDRDPEIRGIFTSFRFITPPAAPTASSSATSTAYRAGYLVGRIGALALVFIGGVAIIGNMFGRRRNHKPQPNVPPPLPPPR
jgi:hypothetical protein